MLQIKAEKNVSFGLKQENMAITYSDPNYAKHAFTFEMYSKTHFLLHMFNDMDRPHTVKKKVTSRII